MDAVKRTELIDDAASIGANLNLPGPGFFYERLKRIRQKPNVQDVLVEVIEVEERDPATWPFSDRVHIFTSASGGEVAEWCAELEPDEVEERLSQALKPGFKCYSLWWD